MLNGRRERERKGLKRWGGGGGGEEREGACLKVRRLLLDFFSRRIKTLLIRFFLKVLVHSANPFFQRGSFSEEAL